MSFYRRFNDGKTERWIDGMFVPCARDEPETRKRNPTEGMIIVPADMAKTNVLSIGMLMSALRCSRHFLSSAISQAEEPDEADRL